MTAQLNNREGARNDDKRFVKFVLQLTFHVWGHAKGPRPSMRASANSGSDESVPYQSIDQPSIRCAGLSRIENTPTSLWQPAMTVENGPRTMRVKPFPDRSLPINLIRTIWHFHVKTGRSQSCHLVSLQSYAHWLNQWLHSVIFQSWIVAALGSTHFKGLSCFQNISQQMLTCMKELRAMAWSWNSSRVCISICTCWWDPNIKLPNRAKVPEWICTGHMYFRYFQWACSSSQKHNRTSLTSFQSQTLHWKKLRSLLDMVVAMTLWQFSNRAWGYAPGTADTCMDTLGVLQECLAMHQCSSTTLTLLTKPKCWETGWNTSHLVCHAFLEQIGST